MTTDMPAIVLTHDTVALVLRPDGGEVRWGTEPEDGAALPKHFGLIVAIASRLNHDPDFADECVRWFLANFQAPAASEPTIELARPVQ